MWYPSVLVHLVLGCVWMVQGKVAWDGRAPLDYGALQLDTSSGPYLTYALESLRDLCNLC